MIKEVNLERAFVMHLPYQLQEFLEVIDRVNQLIREHNKLPENENVIWAKEDNGKLRIGYKTNPDAEDKGIHNNMRLEYNLTDNKAVFQFVILDAVQEWGLGNKVFIYGAPEESKRSGIIIPFQDEKIDYVIYNKK